MVNNGEPAVENADSRAGEASAVMSTTTRLDPATASSGETESGSARDEASGTASGAAATPDPDIPSAAAEPPAPATPATPTIPQPRRRVPGLKAPALPTGPGAWTAAVITACVMAFAVLAYQRRWIADDGMIAVRTARQIVAGNGPVYSPFERAETNTSTLWTYIIALGGWMSGVDIARIAVWAGLASSVAALGISLDATRRFYLRITPSSRALLPAGVLVVLAVSPFWDYATSGLETGLCFLWIAVCWWLLVAWCATGPSGKKLYSAAVVFGLGPLVRPEFALIGLIFAGVTWLLVRPGLRRTLGLTAAAGALPVLYEVFRAGYYGTLVPLPALAKSASTSLWTRGWRYMGDYFLGYLVFIPAIILTAALAVYMERHIRLRAERLLLLAPLASGVVLCLYVVRVGGDFMHARMMLAPTFLLVLPVMLLPLSRKTFAVAAAVGVWAVTVGLSYSVTYVNAEHAAAEDEHLGYQYYTGQRNPDSSGSYSSRETAITQYLAAEKKAGIKILTSEGGAQIPLDPALGIDAAVVAGRLGTVGASIPLDDLAVDTLGLSNPLGARITVTVPGKAGHEKVLPWAWIIAAYGDPAVVEQQQVMDGVDPADVRAARHAMSCGALKEMLDSTRQPMTFGRFWDNLTGSVGRTTLVVPADPAAAEKKFCG